METCEGSLTQPLMVCPFLKKKWNEFGHKRMHASTLVMSRERHALDTYAEKIIGFERKVTSHGEDILP